MKRLAVAVAGVVFGLFVSWLCLYSFSRIDWPVSNRPASGCHEIAHCPIYWWTYPLLIGTLIGPSLLLGLVNAAAWKRWTLRRWSWTFGLLTLLTGLFYLAGYLLPSFS